MNYNRYIIVSLEGLINLSGSLPIYIMSIKSSLLPLQQVGKGIEGMITKVIVSDMISVVTILYQIFLGMYLVKLYKKRIN